jgi:hypothetical protein
VSWNPSFRQVGAFTNNPMRYILHDFSLPFHNFFFLSHIPLVRLCLKYRHHGVTGSAFLENFTRHHAVRLTDHVVAKGDTCSRHRPDLKTSRSTVPSLSRNVNLNEQTNEIDKNVRFFVSCSILDVQSTDASDFFADSSVSSWHDPRQWDCYHSSWLT